MNVANSSITEILQATAEPPRVGFLHALTGFLRDFLRTAFDTYHPERHYMRGPGPACAAKRANHHA